MRDARGNYERSKDLHAKKFISEATLDAARARYEKAQAGISSLKAGIGVAEANARQAGVALEQTLIRAPFDGIVLTKRHVDTSHALLLRGRVEGCGVNWPNGTLEVEATLRGLDLQSKSGSDRIQLDAYRACPLERSRASCPRSTSPMRRCCEGLVQEKDRACCPTERDVRLARARAASARR